MSTKTIVMAEDNPQMRRLYTDFLNMNGFNVMASVNGIEALSLLHRVQPRLILLDIMMPDPNGIETCRRARSFVDPKIPIVFLSSLDSVDYVKDGLEAGGDDYILKTSPLGTILERVQFWTSPNARSKSEGRREKAIEGVRATAEFQELSTSIREPEVMSDKRADDLSEFLERAIAATSLDFGGTPEQRLYFIGYVAGVVDFDLGSNGDLQPQFLKYMRGSLLSGDVMTAAQVEEAMNTLGKLTTSEPVKNGWARGRRDKSAADLEGQGFVPNGLADLRSVA